MRGSPRVAPFSLVLLAVDKVRGVRLTIHHSLTGKGDVDLEVVRGTPLREVVTGFAAPFVWCGDVKLSQEHAAGDWPFLAGAVLSAHPRRANVAPTALHLAAVAGPDTGVIIPLDTVTAIGSAPPAAVVRDEAIDANHLTVFPTSAGALRVRDSGTVNGTGVWSLHDGTLSWRGRRRTATVRVGDVITIGCTLLEARRGLAPGLATTTDPQSMASTAPVSFNDLRERIRASLIHVMPAASRLLDRADKLRGRRAPRLAEFPDPTRTDGWTGPIAVGGAHAVDLARAVILARGRRPPHPMPIDEPWLTWLPPALASDGHIRIGKHSTAASDSGWTFLGAETDRTTSRLNAITWTGPVVRVGSDTADALARSRAGGTPDPPSRTIHWADAAALVSQPSGCDARLRVVAGVRVDAPSVPWTIAIGPASRHTLVAGTSGSGKTTLLATIVGALAVEMPPLELAVVILCAGAPGVLDAYLDLPHVTAAASHVRPSEALGIVNSLDTRAALTLVIADDIDSLGPDGRAVIARLEAIATRGEQGQVHVVMATRRPTAVLTPTLRAATGTAIALRTACNSDSVEVIGIDAAARIPIDAKGMAFVRSGGRVERVQVALPFADRAPRVRRCDAPVSEATTLAAAALTRSGSTRRDPQVPGDLARPAS